jgi:hypothetical protein
MNKITKIEFINDKEIIKCTVHILNDEKKNKVTFKCEGGLKIFYETLVKEITKVIK